MQEKTNIVEVQAEVSGTAIISEKITDAMTPGYQAEFDPIEAEQAGAFVEDALSENDAAESSAELLDDEPAFLDEGGPSDDIPPHITLANSRELFGVREDETVNEAIERNSKG